MVRVGFEPGRLVLGEILRHDLMPFGARPGIRRFDPGEHAHQRRLAGAVGADEGNAIAALDEDVDAPEHDPPAVCLAHAAQVEHRPPALRARREREVDTLALRRNLDRDDLLPHLDPALDLRRLGRGVAEAVDEGVHPRQLVILVALLLAEPLHPGFTLDEVGAVVAGVVGQPAHADVGDARDHGVEEEAVVRDEDDGVRVAGEVFFEPVARFQIEVVRRLVEQQQSGAPEQQLGERDPHLPPAGERLARLGEIVRREAQPAQHRRDLEVDAVALEPAEILLQVAVARQHRGVLRLRHMVVGEAVFEGQDLRAHVEQGFEGEAGLFEEGPAAVIEAVLGEVSDRQARWLGDLAAVGLVEARQHFEQGGLAGAIRTAQSDTLPIVDLPADRVEEDAVAERLAEGGKLDHAGNGGARPSSQVETCNFSTILPGFLPIRRTLAPDNLAHDVGPCWPSGRLARLSNRL